MLIDARRLSDGHTMHADVCVIGGGAAGLTLAREFERHRLRAVVLESGGLRPSHASQRLAAGTSSGHRYYDLDACRQRMLGGTTSAWGGWCRELEPIDFEERDWLPGSGWPFGKEALRTAYARARDTCLLAMEEPHSTDRQPGTPRFCPSDTWQEVRFEIQPLRFGEAYRSLVARSTHVDLLLHATVTELVMDRANRTTVSAMAVTRSGARLSIAAGAYVVAAGGIENARLLLASRRASSGGVGNEHGLVGRYFCEHLHTPVAVIRATEELTQRYTVRRTDGASSRAGIGLSDREQRRERQPGLAFTLHDADDPHDVLSPAEANRGYVSLRHLASSVARGAWPDRAFHHAATVARHLPQAIDAAHRRFVKRLTRTLVIGCRAEQVPDPDNRVTLERDVDAAGMPRVRLTWRPSPREIAAIRRVQQMLAGAFDGESLTLLPERSADGTGWVDRLSAAAHHMGTTRMHRDPEYGVVDEQCRVHDTTNLYVAGSSVFPTVGWAPPTLTIVALAIRLADHLTSRTPAS